MAVMMHEPVIRVGAFVGVLLAMAAWEVLAPRRTLRLPKGRRWRSNLLLVAVDQLVVRVLVPLTVVQLGTYVDGRGIGLLHLVPLAHWQRVLISVIALDFVIYLQHVMFHAVPMLWKLHMIHHADGD